MQCFICVTYMIILCSARPKTKEISPNHEQRSLFHDVIESLRIHTHLPEDTNQNEDNKLQNYDRYSYNDHHLPSDAEFIPRRNDRLEMPSLSYRFPKSFGNDSIKDNKAKEDTIINIDVTAETPKPKTPKIGNKNKPFTKNKDEAITEVTQNPLLMPMSNTMGGQSQIGHRESQTVVKPTIIVNLRGSVSHRDSDIKLEKRSNTTMPDIGRNVFNLKQEINLYASSADAKNFNKKKPTTIKQEMSFDNKSKKVDDDMMMCETVDTPKMAQKGRKIDVLRILFSI